MATDSKPTAAEHKQALRETLKEAGTVMMITRGDNGDLHGRPMGVAHLDDKDNLYFATSASSTKIDEIQRDPRVDIAFQSKTRYATIAGRATISRDRALIEKLWSDSWKIWFPKGKEDPDIALVIVDAERGEYWDQSGLKGLSFLYRAAKALVTGSEFRNSEAEQAKMHGEVKL